MSANPNLFLRTTIAALLWLALAPAAALATDLRSPDARDASDGRYLGQTTYQDLRSPDARDAAQPAPPAPTAATRTVVEPAGFDWPSAAIGAAVLGTIFVVGLGVAFVRRSRPRTARAGV